MVLGSGYSKTDKEKNGWCLWHQPFFSLIHSRLNERSFLKCLKGAVFSDGAQSLGRNLHRYALAELRYVNTLSLEVW